MKLHLVKISRYENFIIFILIFFARSRNAIYAWMMRDREKKWYKMPGCWIEICVSFAKYIVNCERQMEKFLIKFSTVCHDAFARFAFLFAIAHHALSMHETE